MLTPEQKYEILESMHIFGGKLTSISLATNYNDTHADRIDWHSVSDFLEYLVSKKILKVTQGGGFTEYGFNK